MHTCRAGTTLRLEGVAERAPAVQLLVVEGVGLHEVPADIVGVPLAAQQVTFSVSPEDACATMLAAKDREVDFGAPPKPFTECA